nr:type II toxin-antitoxin system VapC family toxin [Desulfobulbaceae bacterium]
MKILLDTCCIIWAVSSPSSLSEKATDLLTKKDSQVYISPISCAEIACLADRGRITLEQHWKVWFNTYTELNAWQVKDITLNVIQEAYSLPDSFHQDPTDRIITATARIHNLTLITADKKILSYPHVLTIW